MSRADALAFARPDEGLDLIEISPKAKPPVARLMNYDKFRYEEEKREKKERLAQKNNGKPNAAARREFFIQLGQVLAPYPEAKQAVGKLLSRENHDKQGSNR